MNYKFETQKLDIDHSPYYFIRINEIIFNTLSRLSDSGWTPQKIQEIIDVVEKNKTLAADKDPYVWGNEDITVFANEIGVLLIDKIALRANIEQTPLELTHNEFITFLKDFKEFVQENS